MLRYLKCQNVKEVKEIFLVHGEYDIQLEWKDKLLKSGFRKVSIPEMHTSAGLN
jgi:metallo-beta-lactamase family protein